MHRYAHPVFSCKEAIDWERRRMIGGETAEWAAMQRAGTGIARGILRDSAEIGGLPPAPRLLVLAGKGHNGADSLLAASELLARCPHATATVLPVFGERAFRPLAARAWAGLLDTAPNRVELVNLRGLRERLAAAEHWDLCLDGILGMQFRLPLPADIANLLAALNEHPSFGLRIAVDLPTGVGTELAPVAFRADFTYATGIVKEPVLSTAAAAWVGRLRYVDLGFFDASEPPLVHRHVLTPAVLERLQELRPFSCDKRTFGHLLIVAGSRNLPGAALMTVMSALRSGAGLVTAVVPESLVSAFSSRVPEAMWVPAAETSTGSLALENLTELRPHLSKATALLAGPGLGRERETQALVQGLLALAECPVLLDADALQAPVVDTMGSRPNRPVVLTPHLGEYARLRASQPTHGFVESTELVDFSQERRAITVLKGPITRISDGHGVWHNTFGGPVLARGGSGDLLAGLIGGRLATGGPDSELVRVAQGVVWHGLAADRLARHQGATSAVATDLLAHLAPVLHNDKTD